MAEPLEFVVKRCIAKVLTIPEEDILFDDNLQTDLDVDSLDQVVIAMELEEVLEIQFPDHEFDKIQTVQDVVMVTEQCMMRKK